MSHRKVESLKILNFPPKSRSELNLTRRNIQTSISWDLSKIHFPGFQPIYRFCDTLCSYADSESIQTMAGSKRKETSNYENFMWREEIL